MKIVHISPSFHTGGGEKFAVDMCNELVEDKNEVSLIVLEKFDSNFILYKKLSKNVKIHPINKEGSISFSSIIKIFKILKKIKPDIVHTHLRGLPYSALSLIMLRIPTVHTVHNIAEREAGKNTRTLYNLLFNRFNITPVGISNTVMKSIQKIYGNSFNNCINNGVPSLSQTSKIKDVLSEIENYKINEETKIILNIGRISQQKNQQLLIDIFKKYQEEKVNIVLLIIGPKTTDTNIFNEIMSEVKDLNNTYYLGEKDNVSDYISSVDAICLSSLYEGLPLVVLETMSMGKKIVSTPAGGVPDVINKNKYGYISEDFTLESLKKELDTLYNENGYNSDLIKKEFNNNYHLRSTVLKYTQLYKKLIKR